MNPREQKIEQVRLLSDEEVNSRIIELCEEHGIEVRCRKFTKSLNAIRSVEDYGCTTLYRWIETYEDWLDDVRDSKTPIWNVPPRHKAEAILLAANLV